jgi:type I restriction enzyme M protein
MLFLQHITKSLKRKRGSRAGVVVPEGMLFRGGAFASMRKELLEEFNLHTAVSMPPGVFLPYSGVKTNVLFFDRPGPTQDVWHYEIRHDGFSLTQTRRPIPENDIPDMLEKWRARAESEWSWIVPAEEIAANSYDQQLRPDRPQPLARRGTERCSPDADQEEAPDGIAGGVAGVVGGK